MPTSMIIVDDFLDNARALREAALRLTYPPQEGMFPGRNSVERIDIDGLAEHMASHNTPFSKGAIKGMITDMVSCVKELTLQGFAVKIDDLAIFSIGIRNKEGAASEKEFTIAKNIEGFRLRARGTGEFSAKTINLEATLKKASALLGDGTTTDTNPDTGKDTGKDTPGGDNTDQGGSGTTGGSDVGM